MLGLRLSGGERSDRPARRGWGDRDPLGWRRVGVTHVGSSARSCWDDSRPVVETARNTAPIVCRMCRAEEEERIMPAEQIGVAVVGVGIWGQNHALAYSDDPRCRLVCVCDRDERRAREVAERFGCDYTTRVEEVAASADVEIVSIATPDFAHFAPAMAAIAAGKHVLIEKPLATDVEEARKLADAAETAPGKAMVNFQLRWHPSYLAIKEAILAGRLGHPYMGYIRLSNTIDVPTKWFHWSARSGPHWFQFSHAMDVMRWFLEQEPVEVVAVARKEVLASRGIDTYDSVQALVRFADGVATFESSWIVPNSSPSVVDGYLSLHGTSGKVELDTDYAGLTLAADRFAYPRVQAGTPNIYGRLSHPMFEPMRYFVDCVVEGRRPAVTLRDGLVNTLMIDATVRSIEERRPVRVEAPLSR